jgi:23S rRNA (uracil1939-C5)-methyltransferase
MNDAICPAAPEKSPLPAGALRVESMDLDAQGIAHREDGKVVFIDGALPFEVVRAQVNRKKNTWENATLTEVLTPSTLRVAPPCPHFGLHQGACGGCKMQHLEAGAQVAIKQRVLEDNLWHLGKVKAQTILRPIQGPALGYRYRARLSVRYVTKKHEVLIGFHERKSRYIADMQSCAVLPPHVSALLLPLRGLIASMDIRDQLPQIELACGDHLTALVLRHLAPLEAGDQQKLRDFAAAHPDAHIQWWLQAKGPDSVQLLDADDTRQLDYALPEFGVTMPFKPTDFTQVNPHINRVLVGRAVRLLAVQAQERVIDWFCGLGNFTLPLATQAGQVLGIEGSETLVARARSNALLNLEAISAKNGAKPAWEAPEFVARNLFNMTPAMLIADGHADKWLVDPPREGAYALVQALADIHQSRLGAEGASPDAASLADAAGWQPPQRIVYVSCNPATLARDAEVLVHQAGYACTHAGMVNMFPHTAHVESMAVFEKL